MLGSLARRTSTCTRTILQGRLDKLQRWSVDASRTFASRDANGQPSKSTKNVEELTEELMHAPPSKIPNVFARYAAALKLRFAEDPVDPNLKTLLDVAASQMYLSCADRYEYTKLCGLFGLPDYFSTWFKLTLMHVWMILMRAHMSLEHAAYLRFQRGLLNAMWLDVDKRLEIVGKEHNKSLNSLSDMKKMHGLHLQTLFEYSEGFIVDDARLAGALWRCMYMQREADPIQVANAISYMRSTIGWLDTLDLMDILTEGLKEWRQLDPPSPT